MQEESKKIASEIPIVGFSGAAPEAVDSLIKAGAQKVLRKPLSARDLKAAVTAIISKQEPKEGFKPRFRLRFF